MPVIIPDVWSESNAVTRNTQMNDERGALWRGTPRSKQGDSQF